MKSKLYIAYGSNLNLRQMKYRCPTAKLVGKGTIENYELQFKGMLKKELCVDTVKQLKYRYGNLNGVILHTDRGSQYTSDLFRSILSRYGMIQSLSSTGKCFDNSRMESFFATLKKEKLYQIPTYKMTKEEVKTVIYRYIFGYYNTIRVNSFNPGGWPPSVYRKMCEGEIAA